jgi:DNA recombination protein RmuC
MTASISWFIIGAFLGSIITFVITKKLQNKQNEALSKAHSDIYEKMQLQFENLANKIFKENTQDFSNLTKEKMTEMLDPFREKFEELKKQSMYNNEQYVKLDTHIKDVIQTSAKISSDTNTLASALKGDNMKQGKWGELILEKVLEVSGLRKGEEYILQMGINSKKPDATILLPENKVIFIDAKTTLSSYDAYINAENEDDEQAALEQFNTSVKAHIAGLASREYFDMEEYISPEYVLMFIPIESCYTMLFGNDSALWELAWKNKIMPVSPSTLLAALKIINNFNMVDRQNKNAQEIARLAGRMIDKFADMVKDLNSVQKNLSLAMTRITGKDNIIRQAERLVELGAKSSKQIPEPVEQLETAEV